MKTTRLVAALLIAVAPVWANEPTVGGRTTCWYDQNGKLTGSSPAEAGAKPGTTVQMAAPGDRAWSRTVIGDAGYCPAKLPVSSLNQ
jgi:hypothetical protein